MLSAKFSWAEMRNLFIFRERKQKHLLRSKVATPMTTDYLSDQILPSNFTHFTTCLDWNQGCCIYFQLRLRGKEWKAKPQFEEEHNKYLRMIGCQSRATLPLLISALTFLSYIFNTSACSSKSRRNYLFQVIEIKNFLVFLKATIVSYLNNIKLNLHIFS